MLIYKIGKITYLKENYIVLESNYQGLRILIANQSEFELEKIMRVYIYVISNDYGKSYYGFKTFKERILFENLIGVNNIGPKTALNIMKSGFHEVTEAISSGDAQNFVKLTNLSLKKAQKILFELSEKYSNFVNGNESMSSNNELKESLANLGFNQTQIKKALSSSNGNSEALEVQIENAIKSIASG